MSRYKMSQLYSVYQVKYLVILVLSTFSSIATYSDGKDITHTTQLITNTSNISDHLNSTKERLSGQLNSKEEMLKENLASRDATLGNVIPSLTEKVASRLNFVYGSLEINEIAETVTKEPNKKVIQVERNSESNVSQGEEGNSHPDIIKGDKRFSYSKISKGEEHNSHVNTRQREVHNSHVNISQGEVHNSHVNISQGEVHNSHVNTSQGEVHNSHVNTSQGEVHNSHVNTSQGEVHNSHVNTSQGEVHNSHVNTSQGEVHNSHVNTSQGEVHNSHVNTSQGEVHNSHVNTSQGEVHNSHVNLSQGEVHNSHVNINHGEGHNSHVNTSQGEVQNSHINISQGEEHNSHINISQGEVHNSHINISQGEEHNSHINISQGEVHNSHINISQGEEHTSHINISQGEVHNLHVNISQGEGHNSHFNLSQGGYNFSKTLKSARREEYYIKSQLKKDSSNYSTTMRKIPNEVSHSIARDITYTSTLQTTATYDSMKYRTQSHQQNIDLVQQMWLKSTPNTRINQDDNIETTLDMYQFDHHSKVVKVENVHMVTVYELYNNWNSTKLTITLLSHEDSVTAMWSFESNDTQVTGFLVTYRINKREHYDSSKLGKNVRSFTLHSLHEDEDYVICVHAMVNTTAVKEACAHWNEASMKIVVGIMAGILFLIPCIIIVIWILVKDRRVRKKMTIAKMNTEVLQNQKLIDFQIYQDHTCQYLHKNHNRTSNCTHNKLPQTSNNSIPKDQNNCNL